MESFIQGDEDTVVMGSLMPELPTEVVAEFEDTDAGVNVPSSITKSDTETENKTKKKAHQPRTHVPRVPKEESHWCRRHLVEEKRNIISNAEGNADASKVDKKLEKQFVATFRVYWSIFQDLVNLVIERGMRDPTKTDMQDIIMLVGLVIVLVC